MAGQRGSELLHEGQSILLIASCALVPYSGATPVVHIPQREGGSSRSSAQDASVPRELVVEHNNFDFYVKASTPRLVHVSRALQLAPASRLLAITAKLKAVAIPMTTRHAWQRLLKAGDSSGFVHDWLEPLHRHVPSNPYAPQNTGPEMVADKVNRAIVTGRQLLLIHDCVTTLPSVRCR